VKIDTVFFNKISSKIKKWLGVETLRVKGVNIFTQKKIEQKASEKISA